VKLGLGSWACAWAAGVPGYPPPQPLTAVGLVQRAASLGVRLVQIADNIPLDSSSAAELRELRAVAGENEVEIELGTRGIGRDQVLRYLELCRFLRSSLLRVVIDCGEDQPSPDEAIARIEALRPELDGAGVTLAVENHDRFDAPTFARIARESGVGICLDTVNSFGALEGPAVVIAALAPYVVSLHVKDFAIARVPHNMGFEITGTPAGQGRLDIPLLLDALRTAGRDPNAILEHWPSWEGSVAATIAKEDRWVDESVRYLRTLIPQ
jgi:3-oxoisoapionate decarboxylase